MRCLSGSCPLAVLPHASLVVAHARSRHGDRPPSPPVCGWCACRWAATNPPLPPLTSPTPPSASALQPENGVEELRAAICHVLDQPYHQPAAQRMANAVEPTDRIIDEIEALAATTTPVPRDEYRRSCVVGECRENLGS